MALECFECERDNIVYSMLSTKMIENRPDSKYNNLKQTIVRTIGCPCFD